MKQTRDALRIDNIRLRQKGGLVCHSALLRDFEERRDQASGSASCHILYHHGGYGLVPSLLFMALFYCQSEELRARLESLQQRHSELTVLCDGLRKKIEQTRTMQPPHL